ncbi:DUF6678 family protein [Shimazuella kribbensis]|uniref:DUF6678 family protein n=1 Tax=Shimazuella kribbensis TaxID=139808 RepID=UPI00041AE4AE|nr:DUF6678 family protein [Shimazuella kribbensis]
MDDVKRSVQTVIVEKQLFSVMNNTKWEMLRKSVASRLPFPPPYQIKGVLEDTPYPQNFNVDVWYWGDWSEGLQPFYAIEWICVRPRYIKRGEKDKSEIIDIRDEFIVLLHQLKIPFVEKHNSIYIYGYVHNMEVFHNEK